MAKNSYESSMTDLMISLALIFMLLLAGVMLKLHNQADELTQTRDEIKEELINQLTEILNQTGDIKIDADKDDPLSLVIVLGESSNALKFKTGEYILDSGDKQFLNKIMPVILNVIYNDNFRDNIDTIKIEGYTDDVKFKNDPDGNVLLSQKRALEVLNYTRNSALHDNDLRDFFIDKASINGKGALKGYTDSKGNTKYYWILNDDNNSCDKEKSRRVEIKIKIKSEDEKRLRLKLSQNIQN